MKAAKPRILCVDDEQINLDLLEALLVPRNYEVIRSTGGRDALMQVASQKVDLVLLDVMMPEIDGFEVCRRIKSDERYRNLPVIMATVLYGAFFIVVANALVDILYARLDPRIRPA